MIIKMRLGNLKFLFIEKYIKSIYFAHGSGFVNENIIHIDIVPISKLGKASDLTQIYHVWFNT